MSVNRFVINRQRAIGKNVSVRAEGDEAQPRLFSDGGPVDVEDMLLEMIRPAEVLAAEGAGEGIPGSEAAALVSGVSRERRSRPVPTSAHYAPKWQFAVAATQDDLLRGAGCKHTGGGLLHHTGSCRTHETNPSYLQSRGTLRSRQCDLDTLTPPFLSLSRPLKKKLEPSVWTILNQARSKGRLRKKLSSSLRNRDRNSFWSLILSWTSLCRSIELPKNLMSIYTTFYYCNNRNLKKSTNKLKLINE